ncbi:MAG: hypothetical protein ACYSSO_15495 [Planctomycetota bacterium]
MAEPRLPIAPFWHERLPLSIRESKPHCDNDMLKPTALTGIVSLGGSLTGIR